MENPFNEISARLDALVNEVRAINRSTEKAERTRRVLLPEAARYVGLAERTVYKKCHFRKMPHSKVGGRLYFDLDQLDLWITNGRRPMASEIALERMQGNHGIGKC
jgi:excisionase family DNA binding protein